MNFIIFFSIIIILLLVAILTITTLNYTKKDNIQNRESQPEPEVQTNTREAPQPLFIEQHKEEPIDVTNTLQKDLSRIEYKVTNLKDTLRSYRDFQFFQREAKPSVYRSYYDENVCFAIVTATYRRKDGTTPMLLSETIDAVLRQTYTNWKWFIIGDYYDDEPEIQALMNEKIPEKIREKVVFYNMPEPGERGKVDPSVMWNVGGRGAMNVGVEMLKEYGLKWYVHLDDDDPWEAHHLNTLYHGIKSNPKVNFVFTQAKHKAAVPLPFTGDNVFIQNSPASPYACIHSTWCLNIEEFDMNYNPNNFSDPADAFFLSELHQKYSDVLYFALMPIITLDHSREGSKKDVINLEKLLVTNNYHLYNNPGWMEFSSDPMMVNRPYIDLSDIPYQDSVFFSIFISDTIYDECKYKHALMRELHRILNHYGVLFIQTNNLDMNLIQENGFSEIPKRDNQKFYIYQAIEDIDKNIEIHALTRN